MGHWQVRPSPTTRSTPNSKIQSPKPFLRNCRTLPIARKSTTTSSPGRGQGSLNQQRERVFSFRVDTNVGQKDHFYYNLLVAVQRRECAERSPPSPLSTASPANPENAPIQRLNWEHTLSSLMTNHATVGYLSRNEGYYALNGKAKLPTVPGVGNTSYLPQMNFGGNYSQLGQSNPPDPAAKPNDPRNLGSQRCLHSDSGKNTPSALVSNTSSQA